MMTTAAQAFLVIGGTLCLSFASIYVFWFADALRSNFLGKPYSELKHRGRSYWQARIQAWPLLALFGHGQSN